MSARRGFTLIETLVVLSAVSVVLTLTTLAIHRVMRSHQQSRAFLADEATAWRLGSTWRRDVSRATDSMVERDEGTTRVALHTPGESPIQYVFGGQQVSRRQQLGDSIAHEAFAFSRPQPWVVTMSDDPSNQAQRLVVEASHRVDQGSSSSQSLAVRWVTRLLRATPSEGLP